VSGGRRAIAVVAALLLLCIGGVSAAQARGRLVTDGLLTVGGQETITVNRIPHLPHVRLSPAISPPVTATDCFKEAPINLGFFEACIPQPLYPVPGTPPMKRNKKGRASLTFVMPSAYEFIDYQDPTKSHPINLVDGQTVELTVDLIWKPKSGGTAGGSFVYRSVVVQVPPAATP
jgi:hypothetical protein